MNNNNNILAALMGGEGYQLQDPITMNITPTELLVAQTIKAAVEANPDLQNLTDFEYVQYALTHPTTNPNDTDLLTTALNHMAKMQAFREEYQIQDTVEEGIQFINQMTLDQPGLFLAIQYLPPGGNTIAINDWAAFFPGRIKTQQQHTAFLMGSYYRFQAMSPTFMAIRSGMSNVFECEGVSFDNYDSRFQEQLFAELYLSYPKRHKEIYFINSPSVVNVAYGLWKRYMTQNMKESFHVGYQIPGMEGQRIDGLFKTPTAELGRQKMVQDFKLLLQYRYHYQKEYKLPSIGRAAANNHAGGGAQQPQPQQN